MKISSSLTGGFTLIEILIGIAVISIVALASTQVDFTRLSQKQKLSVTTADIMSKIEAVRDATITGKGVGTPLVTPDWWEIELSTTGGGILVGSYNTGSTHSFPASNWNSDGKTVFSSILCEKLDGSTGALVGSGKVRFTENTTSLTGCPDIYYKKLVIQLQLASFKENIEFNSINGVISKR